MKIYSLFLSLLTLAVFTACQSDDVASTPVADSGTDVSLTVAVRDVSTSGIATRAFADSHAVAGEMMKNYVIVAVDEATNKITHLLSSGDLATEEEKDTYTDKVHFDTGTYTFYTFANLTLAQLGLSSAKVGDTAPDFSTKTLAVDGNQRAVTAFTAGIPMSYKQSGVVINAHTASVSLYVTRMVAKMTLRLTNVTDKAMTLNSITLSDITKNAADNTASDGSPVPNLYLLPQTATDANGKEYCTPHLTTPFPSTADASSYSGNNSYSLYGDYTINTSATIPANNSASPSEVTFYVNESQAHDPANFELTLNLTTTQSDGTTTNTANRYTVLNWTAIGRNDYRVIPITLDDYKLTFTAQQFTAIGVLPPTFSDDGTTLDLGFSYYGAFHLIPKITRWSDGSDVTASVSPQYDASTCWTLVTGSNAVGFFATAPYWSATNKWVEGYIGFTAGTSAVYRLRCTITKADGTQQTLSRNVRFRMTPKMP